MKLSKKSWHYWLYDKIDPYGPDPKDFSKYFWTIFWAGEAEAIKRKQVSLTGTYIDYLKIQKWDGVMPTVQGSGGGLIIDLKK